MRRAYAVPLELAASLLLVSPNNQPKRQRLTLPSYKLRYQLVLEATSLRYWNHGRRVITRGRNLSNHVKPFDSRGWLWLGPPDMCLSNPRSTCFWQPYCQIAISTEPQACEVEPVLQATDRNSLSPYHDWIILVLPGPVLANQLHTGAVDRVWDVCSPRFLYDPHS